MQANQNSSLISERPALVSALLGGLVLVAVVGLWRFGKLQFLELKLYDLALRLQTKAPTEDSRVTIIGVNDRDVIKYGWPLNDSRLAKLLTRLEASGPRAIGVDLYRDLPEPRMGTELGEQKDGELLAELNVTLTNYPNIVFIYRLSPTSRALSTESVIPDTPPPPVLANRPGQIGFNDLPEDDPIGKVVRRGLLYAADGTNDFTAFGLQLATLYLRRENIHPQTDPQDTNCFRLGKLFCRPFEPNDGAYVNADASGFQFILDFKGPYRFPTPSVDDVFTGVVPANQLRDKVVLIGVTARTVNDPINTPLGTIQYGVVLHAHVIDQLLRAALEGDRPIRSWPEALEAAWIALWCFAGAALGYSIRSPFALVCALGGAAVTLMASFGLGFHWGWWLPVIAPATACFPAAALVTSYKSNLEKQQRTVLMRLFSRHVSRDIAEAIWSQRSSFLDGQRPRPQELRATVLFTDLKGFSTIAERMAPSELIHWTNQYMEVMARTVVEHGGVINKFIGDAVMAVFGVPVPRITAMERARDATNAVRCALAMGRALLNLNQQWQASGQPTASMRIGIFTGPLVAGSVGYSERLEYTVLGDTVNTAARLESFDKEVADPDLLEYRCRVLIGEATLLLLDGQFEVSLIGSLKLKGKNEKVTVYRVLREAGPQKVSL